MIELENVCFSYNNSNSLFVDVCLKVEAGHVYGLLGRNGAGKTTLLKLITAGIRPISGTCCVFGFNSVLRSPEMLRMFFLVPEAFAMPSITIKNFINCYKLFYPNFDSEYMNQYNKDTSLFLEQRLDQMSLGQQKKFMIGFGLATKTPLLILEEPTSGLDVPAKAIFRKQIVEACTEERSIIISSNEARELNNMIDQVIVLEKYNVFCNESMYNLSTKLNFIQDRNLNSYDVIYSESIFGTHNMLVKNNTNEIGNDIDLELFFKATLNSPSKLKNILSK